MGSASLENCLEKGNHAVVGEMINGKPDFGKGALDGYHVA